MEKILSFIAQLNRYFKTDFFYLIKGGFWLGLGKAVGLTTSFLLALAWANWIDPHIYGNYQYLLSLAAIISILSLPGIGSAVIRGAAKGFEGTLTEAFRVQLKWGFLTTPTALAAAGYYWLQNNLNLALPLVIIAFFLPLFNASVIYQSFLVGKKRFDVQVKFDATTQILAVALMVSVLFFAKSFLANTTPYLVILLIFTVYYGSRTLLRFFFFRLTRKRFQENTVSDPQTITFGKHLSFLGAIDVVANNIDKVLLFHYLGAANLAIYAFAIVVPEQIRVLINYLGDLSLPKFATRPREEIKRTLLRRTSYLALLVGAAILVYIAFAPLLYRIFFPQYTAAIPYSQIFALSAIPFSFGMISNVFRAKMMTRQIYQIKISAPIVRAAIAIILVPAFGIWGAVATVIAARTFNALLYLILVRKI